MKTEKSLKTWIFTLMPIFILLIISLTPLLAGPGTTDDPIISLSYLQIATRYGEVPIKKGDELPILGGSTFILVDGSIEMRGAGDYYLFDLTAGKKYKRGKDITDSHLYLVSGGTDLKIAARNDSKILVTGGDSKKPDKQ